LMKDADGVCRANGVQADDVRAAKAIQARWLGNAERARFLAAKRRRIAAASVLTRWWSRIVGGERCSRAAVQIQRVERGRRDRAVLASRERTEALQFDIDRLPIGLVTAENFGMQTIPCAEIACCILSTDPLVAVTDSFLAAAECKSLIACATEWRRSGVSTTLGGGTKSKGRTSTTAASNPVLRQALKPLRARLAVLLGVDIGQLEPSSVLHYGQGGAYRWHHDAYDEATARGKANMARRGQRLMTCIVYLNDMPDGSGGETAFFYLRRAVAPRTGRLLTFRNVSGGGALNRRSLHAGLPVVNGSKWIVTTFLRET